MLFIELLKCYRGIFFADVPCLDNGRCVSLDVTAGMALVMPANVIHLVETVVDSVAFGCNFIDEAHLPDAIDAVREEMIQPIPDTMMPFKLLGILFIRHLMSGVVKNVDTRHDYLKAVADMWPLLGQAKGAKQLVDRIRQNVST